MTNTVSSIALSKAATLTTTDGNKFIAYQELHLCNADYKDAYHDKIEKRQELFSDKSEVQFFLGYDLSAGELIYRVPKGYQGIHDEYSFKTTGFVPVGLLLPNRVVEVRFDVIIEMSRLYVLDGLAKGTYHFGLEDGEDPIEYCNKLFEQRAKNVAETPSMIVNANRINSSIKDCDLIVLHTKSLNNLYPSQQAS
jgi:hypothetical protein